MEQEQQQECEIHSIESLLELRVVLYTSLEGFAATLQTHQSGECISAHALTDKQFKQLAEIITDYAIKEGIIADKGEL